MSRTQREVENMRRERAQGRSDAEEAVDGAVGAVHSRLMAERAAPRMLSTLELLTTDPMLSKHLATLDPLVYLRIVEDVKAARGG